MSRILFKIHSEVVKNALENFVKDSSRGTRYVIQ